MNKLMLITCEFNKNQLITQKINVDKSVKLC